MSSISIRDSFCWVCGEKGKLTVHHGIPRHLNPINNVTLPICKKCHKKINSKDFAGMVQYLGRIKKLFGEGSKGLVVLNRTIIKHFAEHQLEQDLVKKEKEREIE